MMFQLLCISPKEANQHQAPNVNGLGKRKLQAFAVNQAEKAESKDTGLLPSKE